MIRLAVRVRRAQAELVLAELLELAPAGVEEVDLGADAIEYAVYGSPGELPTLPDLRAAVGGALVEISTSEIADDWQERWKRFHRPALIEAPRRRELDEWSVPDLHVRPPWEAPASDAEGRVQDIVIDPGQAFGTGAHATTRLCLELLLELASLERPCGALLDVGTGSGLLGIAGARLGFAPVLGLDNEHESIEAARDNAARNAVDLEVRHFDLRSQPLPWLDAGEDPQGSVLVLANLLRPLLLELERKMVHAPAHVLAGGLLRDEVDDVAAAFAGRLGLRERERRERGEWAALWMTAP
ncbi:MAG: methyltransferase [Solirubrobacterales bacterium]|nr:methyltransferase [Solirubrobacterales bacterium]